jgi:hypothetical protein
MENKQSKFKPSEIKAILPDGTVVLKEGVKRNPRYSAHTERDETHRNEQILMREKYYRLMVLLYGEDHFELGVSE